MIREKQKGPYKQTKSGRAYKTPVKVNGREFYRKTTTVTSDTPPPRYADVLAKWATDSNTSLNEAMGPKRAEIFKRELDRMNRDPQQILNWMLTGQARRAAVDPITELKKRALRRRTARQF